MALTRTKAGEGMRASSVKDLAGNQERDDPPKWKRASPENPAQRPLCDQQNQRMARVWTMTAHGSNGSSQIDNIMFGACPVPNTTAENPNNWKGLAARSGIAPARQANRCGLHVPRPSVAQG